MEIKTNNLDKRICDVETETLETQTYREYINNMEKKLGNSRLSILRHNKDLDDFTNKDLIKYRIYLNVKKTSLNALDSYYLFYFNLLLLLLLFFCYIIISQ